MSHFVSKRLLNPLNFSQIYPLCLNVYYFLEKNIFSQRKLKYLTTKSIYDGDFFVGFQIILQCKYM